MTEKWKYKSVPIGVELIKSLFHSQANWSPPRTVLQKCRKTVSKASDGDWISPYKNCGNVHFAKRKKINKKSKNVINWINGDMQNQNKDLRFLFLYLQRGKISSTTPAAKRANRCGYLSSSPGAAYNESSCGLLCNTESSEQWREACRENQQT